MARRSCYEAVLSGAVAQAGRKTVTQSFSFAPATLDALRRLAEANGTNLSVEMRAAVQRHLDESRATEGVGDVAVTVRAKEVPDDRPRRAAVDDQIGWMQQHFGDRRPKPEIAPLSPRRYAVGAVSLFFEDKPWSEAMLAQFESRIGREVALLWAAERERVEQNGGPSVPRMGGGMADPRDPSYGRQSGRYR
jgi:hypothetical protein